MKKLLFILMVATLVSCNCLRPQNIPPQTIYTTDSTCTAELPNYLPFFSVRDNCEGVILTQNPLPGTELSASVPYIKVHIIAADLFDNRDSVSFDVFLHDSIKPVITVDSTFLTDIDAFELLDLAQASFRPYISDSVWNTHNLVMISSPLYQHMGGWYHTDYHMITATDEDLDKLGYTTYKLYLIDPTPVPLAINAGGPALEGWVEDQYYTSERGGPGAILETAPGVYKTERWGDFQYDLPIGNGTFEVELHFAEIYHDDIGERIFSVHVEDSLVLDQYDILTEAAVGEPVIKRFTIRSDFDGYLRIKFSTTEDGAKISGIKVSRALLVSN